MFPISSVQAIPNKLFILPDQRQLWCDKKSNEISAAHQMEGVINTANGTIVHDLQE